MESPPDPSTQASGSAASSQQDHAMSAANSTESQVDNIDNNSESQERHQEENEEDTVMDLIEEQAGIPPSQEEVEAEVNEGQQTDGRTICIISPAPYGSRPKALSSRIRDTAEREQHTQAEVAGPQPAEIAQPLETTHVLPYKVNQEFFEMDGSVDMEGRYPEVSNNTYTCSLFTENDQELYTGLGCNICFISDYHLSFVEIAIESTDKRKDYEEDILSGSYLRFPYLALSQPVGVRFIGEHTTPKGALVKVLELSMPLDLDWLGVQNILVPKVRDDLQPLKDYLIAAKATPSVLKVRVNVYNELEPVINGMLAIDQNMQQHDPDFIARWCTTNRFVIQHNEFISPANRMNPTVAFGQSTTFYTLMEYIVCMCIGDLEEHEKAFEEVSAYNGQFTMFLMHMPGQPDNSPRIYLGLIEIDQDMPRLPPGTRLTVMDPDTEDQESALHATVTLPVPGIPLNFMTVFLPMQWDREAGIFDTGPLVIESDQVLPLPTNVRALTVEDIKSRVQGLEVSLQVEFSDRAYRNRVTGLARLHALVCPTDASALWKSVRQLLLCNDIETVERLNVYSSISNRDEVLQTLSADEGLNEEQQKALEYAQSAPAGFVVIKGPPGTGKSYTARALLKPLVMSGKQVLVCGASNACADDNADKFNRMVRGLRVWEGQYVVRVYAVETEVAITQSPGILARTPPEDVRPALVNPFEEVEEDSDRPATETLASMDVAIALHKLYESQHARKVAFVPDSRVTEKGHTLSIGHRILQLIGQVPSSAKGDPRQPEPNSPNARSIATLAEFYAQYRGDIQFTDEQKIAFTAAIKAVRELVLMNACCICTTPALAIQPKVFSVCAPSVEAIVFDEAGRCTEQEVVTVISSFPRAVLKAIIGDNAQLPPLVKRQEAHPTFFANQYDYSLLDRLIHAGIPHIVLLTQYRMMPDIARVISNFGYQGRLVNDSSVLFENRPMAQRIREWNKEKFNRERCLVYLNLQALATETLVQQGGSRVNATFVAYSIELAKQQMDLNPEATVAILTGYNAQHRLFVFAKSRLECENPVYSKLVLITFDAVQGEEYDVVIVDLLLMQGSAGFLNSPSRLTVALSRPRMALYVLADKAVLDSCKSRSLMKIQSEMLRIGTQYKVKTSVPSRYFTSDDFALLTGNINAGEGNAGEGNAGEGNAGNINAGWENAGEGNAGEGNAGEGNAGEGNAGEGNAGEGNAGEGNAGEGTNMGG